MQDQAEPIVRWKVRYELTADPIEVLLPHAWRQDMPASFEGPVSYETSIKVPRGCSTLVFHGVSYAADVRIEGLSVASHRGIWDAFCVPLDAYHGKTVSVEVLVTKHGGQTYPVSEVAGGFLPYVFHGFGGLHGTVDLVPGRVSLDAPAPPSRVRVEGAKIFLDDRPFYVRGVLHWGWYPDLGHPNPPDLTIREEIIAARARGFNLIKFSLWAPPHRYLEILAEEGMVAWIELPLWRPANDPGVRAQIADEFGRIVRQYRRHDNVIAWTIGCELGDAVPADFRAYLTQLVRNLTGCPLVRDVSGGAEMYGGDLREHGTFYDFHPYSDITFLPSVLDSLLPGPRAVGPLLLGEFSDADVHRDLARIGDEMPFWASSLAELNPRGVRWLHDLPVAVADSRFANHPTRSRHAALMASSRRQTLFVRKTAMEAARARGAVGGYVMTGWRDTPISSSGLFDDWGEARYLPAECADWNGEAALFLIPARRPPWVAGGNRPGWMDPLNHFAGPILWRVGAHSAHGLDGGLSWKILDDDGRTVASGAETGVAVPPLDSREVGEIFCELPPGAYRLSAEYAGAANSWPIWVVEGPGPLPIVLSDPLACFAGLETLPGEIAVSTDAIVAGGLTFLTGDGTRPAPFWREAAYEFIDDAFWSAVPFAERWPRLLAVCSDRVLDPVWLSDQVGDYEVLLNRVDVRTYVDSPVVVRCAKGLVTTLRPFGGLGTQPTRIARNPAGFELFRCLLRVAQA